MNQKTVSPPEWAGFAGLPTEEFWRASDAPIYEAVERQWLAQGREVPRRPGLPTAVRHPVDAGDLFRRA
ncbi:hypothetical protein ACFY7H_24655 [Streptomyces sp. NPDC012794]|uniref:hypothetical protein n=1 Tax=Streptomyces sp. NPDC012794 TaxID=3364850 RepID=UPI003677F1F6